MNPRTGIGRLVSSIIDSARNVLPELKTSIATSEDIFSLSNKLKFLFNFKKILAEAKTADLIHVFDAYPYGFLAVLIGKLVKKPVILTAVGTGSVQGLRRFPNSFLIKYTFRRSFKIIAISHYIKNEILSVIPDLNIEVINPGIISMNNNEKVEIDLLLGKKYILSVGSLKKRKGYDVSIKIFKALLEKYSDLYYVIVAKSDEKNESFQEIRKLIESYGITERVLFIDNLTDEELDSVYQQAKLFILMSRNDNQDVEGFGLVFLEAARAGIPVIGCRGTGAEDAINDGVNGYLVDIKDEEDIIKKVGEILKDENLRERLVRGSLDFSAKMTWGKSVAKYLKLYSQLSKKNI